jgi:hypothetical protein
MRLAGIFLFSFLATVPARADILTFTLDPTIEAGNIFTFAESVVFTGTLTFNSSLNTCDSDFTDCLYLNSIALDPSLTLPSFLALDDSYFYDNVAGSLSDDGVFNSVTGEIFGIQIQPNAIPGAYNGEVDILGAIDDPSNVTSVLATADFTVIVIPEPTTWCFAILGLATLALARRAAA